MLSSKYKRRLLARLIKAQDGRCCYCGLQFTAEGDTVATIEHKRAKMDGGLDRVGNFAAACLHCNSHRGRQMVRDRIKAKKSKLTEAEHHKGFLDMEKEIGASDKAEGFDKAFKNVTKSE